MAALLARVSASQRRRLAYAHVGPTDGKGHYVMGDVAPGKYLLFAGRADRYGSFFAPGFVRSHEAEARKITVGPNANLVVNLSLPAEANYR